MYDTNAANRWRVRVEENIDLFLSLAEDAGYPCPRPPVRYKTKMTRAAGSCGPAQITLSVEYLREFEDRQVWDTLGHEFAHWIQFNHRHLINRTYRKTVFHNAKFYALCRMLGVDDSRCHNMHLQNVAPRRTTKHYTIHCSCKSHKVTKNMHDKCTSKYSTRYATCCKSKLASGPHPSEALGVG